MDRAISRRDFLNGASAVAASALVPGCVSSVATDALQPAAGELGTAGYPPGRIGMRGSHDGSFEVAHQLALGGRVDWGSVAEPDSGTYDLVVVGSGISGLTAAYLQMQRDPGSRILILDNHDDFGGHARRNEFEIGGRTVLGYGGSQTLESPQFYSETSKQFLKNIGVDLERLNANYDLGFHRRHGLAGGVFFDRATYGVDRVVRYELVDFSGLMPLVPSSLSAAEAVDQMPISKPARVEMQRLLEATADVLSDIPKNRQADYLETLSYQTFLERHFDIHEAEVFALFNGILTDTGASIDASPARTALDYVGLPGYRATSLPRVSFDDDAYISHFPDGNASIARLLVRAMIPRVAGGSTMEDVVGAKFDYARLDEANSRVRLRLGSTVIRAKHDGEPGSANRVAVDYVRNGKANRVWARSCVLAGYNAMIPYLCPEMPERQRKALSNAVKVPILYSTVLLKNWRAWKELGLAAVSAPGSYHNNAMLDFPVNWEGYEFSPGPDAPIAVHMERFGTFPGSGMNLQEQSRAERQRMLGTPFSHIEREIRTQLTGTLSGGDFDPARDIEAITVNRWAHGYAHWYSSLFDSYDEEPDAPHIIGRARFGRIAIANSDAGASATIDAAIDQAHRAIEELTEV